MTVAANPALSGARDEDLSAMRRAIALGDSVRAGAARTAPNPWVGAVLVTADGRRFDGATSPAGGPHAEAHALELARRDDLASTLGATLYTTLEPCAHHGRTPPCTAAIVASGISRVVVGVLDPDPLVAGRGVAALEASGIRVEVGSAGDEVAEHLAPYLKHRRTGLPWVVLKLAASLDGRLAAPDGSSRWLTGLEAREDVHRLRAESDAVLVGAGTVRADDPELTVRSQPQSASPARQPEPPQQQARPAQQTQQTQETQETQQTQQTQQTHAQAPGPTPATERQPLRVVLGRAPAGARVHPAIELQGDPRAVLEDLGARGIVQLLVEGGARVAHEFHRAGLVDRYVVYLAPALFGGDDGVPMFSGSGAPTMDDLWRGRLVSVTRLGDDVRIELAGLAGPDQKEAF